MRPQPDKVIPGQRVVKKRPRRPRQSAPLGVMTGLHPRHGH